MSTIQAPNYTQTPNDVFELMPEMKEAELRVVMAILRVTSGEGKTDISISTTQIMQLTGMSKQGVLNGIEDATRRGILKTVFRPGLPPKEARRALTGKYPREFLDHQKTVLRCEWCSCSTIILHRHHYPVPRCEGGKETVNICANCHAEYHVLVSDTYFASVSDMEVGL